MAHVLSRYVMAEKGPAHGRGATIKLRGLLEAAPDAIVVLDREGRIVHVNAQTERLFGYAREDLIGRPHAELVSARHRSAEKAREARYFDVPSLPPTGAFVSAVYGVRKDGTEFPAEISLGYMEGDAGTLVIAFVRDDTERRALAEEALRATREAETANRLKDEFLANLSHELRSPLSAVLGWAQILRGKSDPVTVDKGIRVIERNALVGVKLLEDVLDVSRIVSGKLSLKKVRVELNAIVQAAVEVVRPAADKSEIALEVHLDPDAGRISADPDRLQQIVWNVLANAVKFTPKGGTIELRVRRERGHVEIRVSDTGKGIQPQLLPFIWDRFRQGDSSATKSHGGLGLGLPLVRYLVEAHGGKAVAESPGEGRGSTFTIRLPVTAVHATPPDEPSRPEQPPPPASSTTSFALDGLRILVVDDDRDSRDLVSTVLRDRGADVKTAESAAMALDEFLAFTPDVLVSDIGMPDVDGYELLRRIRALPEMQGHHVKAVSLSAYASAQDRANSLAVGFATHLSKPVTIRELVQTIAAIAQSWAQ
jgi:PAS domain S-box-containing protein